MRISPALGRLAAVAAAVAVIGVATVAPASAATHHHHRQGSDLKIPSLPGVHISLNHPFAPTTPGAAPVSMIGPTESIPPAVGDPVPVPAVPPTPAPSGPAGAAPKPKSRSTGPLIPAAGALVGAAIGGIVVRTVRRRRSDPLGRMTWPSAGPAPSFGRP